MQVFEVGVRIDEKVDLVRPVAVMPHGSAKQVTEDTTHPTGTASPGRQADRAQNTHGKTDIK